MKRTGPTNIITRKLIRMLRKAGKLNKSNAWLKVVEELEKPRRRRVEVNISRINRYAREGEMIIVPGVVLGCGSIKKKVSVAALKFTRSARRKLLEAGCNIMTLSEAIKANPTASNTRIIA
ncbi:MAG: 50S ribosomal protein L18e [Acidilobaceae archaeon]